MATKQGRPCDKYRSSVVEGMSSTNLVNDKCSWSGTCGKEDHPQKTHFGFLWQSYKSFFVFAYLLCYDLPNFYALLQIVIPSYTIVMPCQIGMPSYQIVMPCQIVCLQKQNQLAFHCCNKKWCNAHNNKQIPVTLHLDSCALSLSSELSLKPSCLRSLSSLSLSRIVVILC